LLFVGFSMKDCFAVSAPAFGDELLSARAMGTGGVGVAAQNEDPSTAYLNPAGLTLLSGTQATYGLSWVNLHGEYTDDSGNKSNMRSIDAAVPNAAFSHQFGEGGLAAGLSIESPYGLGTHWPGDGPLRYVATNSNLAMVVVSPALAYRINPSVSIGAGGDYYNTFDAELERHIDQASFGAPDGNSRLSGTAANWGYHGGILIEPNEHNSFGISYRSEVLLAIKGTVALTGLDGPLAGAFGGSNYATAAYTDLEIPQTVQFGYAYKPTDRWMFEFDTAWYDWTENQNLDVRYAETNPERLAILNQGNPQPTNLHNTWGFSVGANHKYSDRIQFRGGAFCLPSATPDSTFSPSTLDLTRYGLSGGIGIALSQAFTLDLSYTAVFYHNETITNNVGANTTGMAAYNIDGTYQDFTNIVMMNLTYRIK